MAKQGESNVVRRVSFTSEEDSKVQHEAEKAGMKVCPYIRQQALGNNTQSIDWDLLRKHTAAINYIAEKVNWYTCNEKPDHWVFEADLSFIQELLEQIKDLESQLIEEICNKD